MPHSGKLRRVTKVTKRSEVVNIKGEGKSTKTREATESRDSIDLASRNIGGGGHTKGSAKVDSRTVGANSIRRHTLKIKGIN